MPRYANLLRNINLISINKSCLSQNSLTPNKLLNHAKQPLYISSRYCQTHVCWKCGEERKSLFEIFCKKCNIIQKPQQTENYFKLIGITESYDIDQKALTKRYRQLQGLLHPDKYSNKSDEEKKVSEEYSSAVNQAYNTLQSPIQRGLHLLLLKGEKIDENQNENTDQQFLMEIMELNEEVEEAQTPEQLLNLNKKSRTVLEEITQELSKAFSSGNVQEAKKILIRMKYYTSVSLQINNILREKGIVE